MNLERRADSAFSIEDLRMMAMRRLPRLVFDFFDGGAEDEVTLRANRAAFEQTRIAPRILVDVATVETRTNILGVPAALPIVVGPTGGVDLGRRGGDVCIAKAAADSGIPYTLSTRSSASIEEIADAAPGRHWFQAYILQNQAFLAKMIDRARAADYEALVITVDLAVGGKRERDLRNGFSAPFRPTRAGLLDLVSHPRWSIDMLIRGTPPAGNLHGLDGDAAPRSTLASAAGRDYDPSFDWARLAALRDVWPRKLVVKGVLRPDDAERLSSLGCDAVVVSNHGGRQLDTSMATFDALPAVAAAAGKMEVMLDGGVRRGVDILKARALGANAVLLGRATLYGAIAAGAPGARRALDILEDELRRAMQLCGAPDFARIDASVLADSSRLQRARAGLSVGMRMNNFAAV
ncbi:alpha-hydroxy acid oxidase [Paraburkholderia oxyphila]|uniref:alpha-hydroxy acid oxidase n=1 Tax=Paraburkholderia oxyphila TaxID=614212 RepID=UPI000A04D304|nr:alpha-hydroxy acid oxidase [Paraburkholderia oxyphila]